MELLTGKQDNYLEKEEGFTWPWGKGKGLAAWPELENVIMQKMGSA